MRKISFLVMVLFLCTWAQEQSNLDEFEKSLVTGVTGKHDTSGYSEFEKSLVTDMPGMESVYKAREELLEAVKAKNFQGVSKKVDELDQMGNPKLIPLRDAEKEAIYVELKMYSRLLDLLVQHYKSLYDTARYDNPTIASGDGLEYHVVTIVNNRDPENNVFYTIEKSSDFKKIAKRKREKIEMFLLLQDIYHNPDYRSRVYAIADTIVMEGKDPDTEWIKKCIRDPLARMDLLGFSLQKRKEQKEFYRKDLFEPADPFLNLEFYLQIFRVAILGEYVSAGVEGLNTYEFGFGVVAFDSRYFKIRPYVALGKSFVDLRPIHDIPDFPSSSQSYGNSSGESTLTVAVNMDFKFATAYFLLSNKMLASFYLATKLGFSSVKFEHTYAQGDGNSFFFSVGLGMYYW